MDIKQLREDAAYLNSVANILETLMERTGLLFEYQVNTRSGYMAGTLCVIRTTHGPIKVTYPVFDGVIGLSGKPSIASEEAIVEKICGEIRTQVQSLGDLETLKKLASV